MNEDVDTLVREIKGYSTAEKLAYASNPSTPTRVLEVLVKSYSSTIRSAVLSNPNAPQRYLHRMVKEGDTATRLVIAKHPNAPVEALQALSTAFNNDIRLLVALHPSTPQNVLEELAMDSVEAVRNAARSHSSLEGIDLPEYIDPSVRKAALLSEPTILDELSSAQTGKEFLKKLVISVGILLVANTYTLMQYDASIFETFTSLMSNLGNMKP